MTQGPPRIVFSKAECIALCRLRGTGVGLASGMAGRAPQCPQDSSSLFCFSELALVSAFCRTHVVAAPTLSLVSGTYSTAAHSPPAFLQAQCGKKVEGLFHPVQTYL